MASSPARLAAVRPPAPAAATPEDRLLALFESETASDIRHICDLCSRPQIQKTAADLARRLHISRGNALNAIILGLLTALPNGEFWHN